MAASQRLRIRLHKVLRHQSSHGGLAAHQLQVIQGQPVLDLPVDGEKNVKKWKTSGEKWGLGALSLGEFIQCKKRLDTPVQLV